MTPPARTIRIAAAAYPLDGFATLGAVEDKIARWVAEAAGAGADVLVFPEYGAMELAAPAGEAVCADLDASLAAVSDALPRIDAFHADLARRHRVHILAGSGPRTGTRRPLSQYRAAVRAIGKIRPRRTSSSARRSSTTGDWWQAKSSASSRPRSAVSASRSATTASSRCWCAPWSRRARKSSSIPACTEFVSGYHRVRTAALARALEGGCATVVSPTVGDFHLVAGGRLQQRRGRHLRPRRGRHFRYRRPRGRHAECAGMGLCRRRSRGAGSTCRYRRDAQSRRLARQPGGDLALPKAEIVTLT